MPDSSIIVWRDRLKRWLPTLFSLSLFSWAIWAITQEMRQYEAAQIWASFRTIPPTAIAGAIGLTGLNYWVLTGYDTLAVRFVGKSLPYTHTALVGLISYGISNGVGFRFFSGGALRYRFYTQWGFSLPQVAQIVTFCSLSFWLGLLSIGGILFLVEPLALLERFDLPFTSTRGLGVMLLVTLLTYLGWSATQRRPPRLGRWQLPQLSLSVSLGQIGITTLDWAIAASVAYTLLPDGAGLGYIEFVLIYLVAQISGVLSNVPGGLGVFESIVLLMLSPPLSSAALLGTLVIYRSIYYGLPLLGGCLLLGIYELRQRSQTTVAVSSHSSRAPEK